MGLGKFPFFGEDWIGGGFILTLLGRLFNSFGKDFGTWKVLRVKGFGILGFFGGKGGLLGNSWFPGNTLFLGLHFFTGLELILTLGKGYG